MGKDGAVDESKHRACYKIKLMVALHICNMGASSSKGRIRSISWQGHTAFLFR